MLFHRICQVFRKDRRSFCSCHARRRASAPTVWTRWLEKLFGYGVCICVLRLCCMVFYYGGVHQRYNGGLWTRSGVRFSDPRKQVCLRQSL